VTARGNGLDLHTVQEGQFGNARLHASGVNAYPQGVGTLDARPRSAVTTLIGVVLVCSVALLPLPRTDVGSFAEDPVGAILGPMSVLVAIASDWPTTLETRRSEHPDAIPAVVSAEAGTRSALLWLFGDVRFPASSIATLRLAAVVVRRGPPFSSPT
jgi:hypothetical protein